MQYDMSISLSYCKKMCWTLISFFRSLLAALAMRRDRAVVNCRLLLTFITGNCSYMQFSYFSAATRCYWGFSPPHHPTLLTPTKLLCLLTEYNTIDLSRLAGWHWALAKVDWVFLLFLFRRGFSSVLYRFDYIV